MIRHLLAGALACGLTPALAQDKAMDLGPVSFNETEINAKSATIDAEDGMAVFQAIFAQMPDQVMIYPTENYYYFNFYANGTKYSGNMRLHPDDRDNGLLHFAYFDTADSAKLTYLQMTEKDGITLTKLSDLAYRLTHNERSVTMRMNPLAQTDPGAPTVAQGESFVGRGFDESGLTFTLIFNQAANSFLWVLDPEQRTEVTITPAAQKLGIHLLSGFAFYQAEPEGRQILLGVDQHQAVRNTWYDGPFDQLPDNWLPDTKFRAFVERSMPGLQGQINDRGEYLEGEARVAVMPYMHYRNMQELVTRIQSCEPPGYQMPPGSMMACLFRN